LSSLTWGEVTRYPLLFLSIGRRGGSAKEFSDRESSTWMGVEGLLEPGLCADVDVCTTDLGLRF
jgi:hypothetical protein